MPIRSSHLEAAIRAIQGESDVETVRPAFADWRLARIVALAPDAQDIIRTVAALSEGLYDLLSSSIVSNAALHNALAWMIGKPEGQSVLRGCAQIAPAGWGAHACHRTCRCCQQQYVQRLHCRLIALIGPCDEAAARLTTADAMSFAIRRWGQSTPATPTSWMHALSPRERERLIREVQRDSIAASFCIPWLPPDIAWRTDIGDDAINVALSAFAEASLTARTNHAELLHRFIERTSSAHLEVLTHLSCAIESEAGRQRIAALLQETPNAVESVVTAVPWEDVPEMVQKAILNHANQSDACAAVAVARGCRREAKIKPFTAVFFAALDPDVWDRLTSADQRRWCDALLGHEAHLAIRSLGLRSAILAKADFLHRLVHAARRHARHASVLRWALLPVALRNLPIDAAHDLIAALPTPPPDPSAFFFIASKRGDSIIPTSACAALQAPDGLALAVALQRCVYDDESFRTRCTTLQRVLCRRTWNDLTSMMPFLEDAVRSALMSDLDAHVERLAHPTQREEMRQALTRLTSLPPDIAIPICVILNQRDPWQVMSAAHIIAAALRAHGDVFLSITSAMTDDDLRDALLPLPGDKERADALRTLARDDPPTAHRLAHALREGDRRAVTEIVLSLPMHHRDALTPASDALSEDLAHPDRRDTLRQSLEHLASFPPHINIPVRLALDWLRTHAGDAFKGRIAAEDIARALREHGGVFLAVVDALADNALRTALLPLPGNAALADALRALARDDPPSAHRLARALCSEDLCEAIYALLHTSRRHADAVWQALDHAVRSEMVAHVSATTSYADLIAPGYPLTALALAAMQSDDDDLRNAGVAALAAHPDVLRAMWETLPQETQQFLRAHPSLALSIADLPQAHDRVVDRRIRRR